MQHSHHPLATLSSTIQTQHGCITRSQALVKIRPDQWRRIVELELLHHAHKGVYLLSGTRENWTQRAWAAQLAAPGSLLSHSSAAKLQGITWYADENAPIELTASRTGPRLPHARVIAHHSRRPDPGITHRETGLRLTSAERTIVDLSATHPPGDLPRILDRFLISKLTSVERLVRYFRVFPLTGRRNGSKLQKLVRDRAHQGGTLESFAERDAWNAMRKRDLKPETQHWVSTPEGRFRLDFAFPQSMLALEIDGPHHRDPDQARSDRQRDAALVAAGWRVLRVTNDDDFEFVLEKLVSTVQ